LEREIASWNVPKGADIIEDMVFQDLELRFFLNRMERSKSRVEAHWDGPKSTGHDVGRQNQGR